MVNPPKKGDESFDLFEQEKKEILSSLKRRGGKLCKALNSLDHMSCNMSNGSMYAFPRIILPKKAVDESKKNGFNAPDEFYCMELLKNTGICVVPGSGFNQKDGTHHLRTTFLPQEDVIDGVIEMFTKFHKSFIAKYL